MDQVVVIEVICFFDKHGNDLVISKWINKDWFPVDSETEPFQLGLHTVPQSELNKLQITFQDESKLQCIVFHKDFNWQFGSEEFIVSQLKDMTGCKSVKMSGMSINGKNDPGLLYIPLRHDVDYALLFSQFEFLRDFMAGEKISHFKYLNGVPQGIPTDAETVILKDSYLESLDFLEGIKNIKSLLIECCIIDNWDYLKKLTSLENLHIESANLPNSRYIQYLAQIKRLSLVDCLQETEGLSGKQELIYCDLSHNWKLTSVDPLYGSKKLKWLSIEHSPINELDLIHWNDLNVLEANGDPSLELYNLGNCQDLKFLDYTFTWFDKATLFEILHLVKKNKLVAFDLSREPNLMEGLN